MQSVYTTAFVISQPVYNGAYAPDITSVCQSSTHLTPGAGKPINKVCFYPWIYSYHIISQLEHAIEEAHLDDTSPPPAFTLLGRTWCHSLLMHCNTTALLKHCKTTALLKHCNTTALLKHCTTCNTTALLKHCNTTALLKHCTTCNTTVKAL